jgi:Tfp pilus assembly protein PilF
MTASTAAADMCRELGLTALTEGRLTEAALLLRKALCLTPDSADAVLALGHCLYLQEQFTAALELYDGYLKSAPEVAAVWNNRGTALLALCRHREAAESYRWVVALEPSWHDSRVALATCYQALGDLVLAEEVCDEVLSVLPDHAEAHWNRALLLLLTGRYAEGWREYEWRWQKRGFTSPHREFPQSLWQGESLAGHTILIHAEQGYGDTLQFCRFVPLVVARGGRVIFECQKPLVPLLQAVFPQVTTLAMGEPLPHFDRHVPLLSLAGLFATTLAHIPGHVPHLVAPEERLPVWRSVVVPNDCLKVGICWAGKAYPDPLRSCPVEQLAPLADIPGISWYSVQAGWQGELPFAMTDLTGRIADFADTAALLAQLDLVVTIDTALAHLAGAMGKSTLVMLPFAADWRWLTDRDGSPWYPSLRLFRQKHTGVWCDVVENVRAELAAMPKGFSKTSDVNRAGVHGKS